MVGPASTRATVNDTVDLVQAPAVNISIDESLNTLTDLANLAISDNSVADTNPDIHPFVVHGVGLADPFLSPTCVASGSQGQDGTQLTPTCQKLNRAMESGNWRSDSSSGSETASSPSKHRSKKSPETHSFRVQEYVSTDSDTSLSGYRAIKDEESQSVYPPSCCVFVANLLQTESEESLQAAVTEAFREYGPVYVKIRRDAKQMPFAFCQYTVPAHAELAIREGRGRLIKGRPCRCEKAKAHRLFFVERRYGPVVTSDEVRLLLQSFGTITSCYTASSVERTALNLNEGVIVEFELYDEGQAAFASYRNHAVFKIHAIAGIASPRKIQSTPEDRKYLEGYEVERCSIFAGNLPFGTTESQLSQLFEHYGPISQINLHDVPSKFDPQGKFYFAFVEFRSPMSVTKTLAAAKGGFTLNGKGIRVSQKDSRAAQKGSSFQSPVSSRRGDLPVSPVSQASPYGYSAYNPYYIYADAQGQYYTTAPYSSPQSPYYTYGNPAYTAYSPNSAAAASSPAAYPPYSYYGYAPVPHYGMFTPGTQQQISPPATNYPAPYHSVMHGSTGQDERSATPTPVGPALVADSTLEAQ